MLRSLSYQVHSPLQFLLQVGEIHLVRDAIGLADALHIAVLNQFFQTPHYGYAWQLQRVSDLAGANGTSVSRRLSLRLRWIVVFPKQRPQRTVHHGLAITAQVFFIHRFLVGLSGFGFHRNFRSQ